MPHYSNKVFINALGSSLSLRSSSKKLQQPFRKSSTGPNVSSFTVAALWNKSLKKSKYN